MFLILQYPVSLYVFVQHSLTETDARIRCWSPSRSSSFFRKSWWCSPGFSSWSSSSFRTKYRWTLDTHYLSSRPRTSQSPLQPVISCPRNSLGDVQSMYFGVNDKKHKERNKDRIWQFHPQLVIECTGKKQNFTVILFALLCYIINWVPVSLFISSLMYSFPQSTSASNDP